MEKLEKIREFLYDLDKKRSDVDAVHNLILSYMGMTENKPSGTIPLTVEIGNVEGDDLRIYVTVDDEGGALWFNISSIADVDLERLLRKEGDCILDTRI